MGERPLGPGVAPPGTQFPFRLGSGVRILAPKSGTRSFRILFPDPEGRRAGIEKTKTMWADAVAVATDAVRQLTVPGAATAGASTVGDAMAAWLESGAATWGGKYLDKNRGYARNHVSASLAALPCASLTAMVVKANLKALADAGHPQETINGAVGFWSNFVGFCRANRFIDATFDPMLGLHAPRSRRASKRQLAGRGEVEQHRRQLERQLGIVHDDSNADDSDEFVSALLIPTRQDGLRLADAIGERLEWWGLGAELDVDTGLRLGELAALGPEKVDVRGCRIVVDEAYSWIDSGPPIRKSTKNGRERIVPFPERLQDRIAHRIEQVERDHRSTYRSGASKNPLRLLFPAKEGGVLHKSNFNRRVLTPARIAAGWPKVRDCFTIVTCDDAGRRAVEEASVELWLWSFHSLRHTFCTYSLAPPSLGGLGLDPTTVAAIAGHKDADFTRRRYVGRTANDLDQTIAAMNARDQAGETGVVVPFAGLDSRLRRPEGPTSASA